MDTGPSARTAADASLFWNSEDLMATTVIGFPPPPAATTAPANSSTGRSSRPAVDIIFDRLTRFRFDRDQTGRPYCRRRRGRWQSVVSAVARMSAQREIRGTGGSFGPRLPRRRLVRRLYYFAYRKGRLPCRDVSHFLSARAS